MSSSHAEVLPVETVRIPAVLPLVDAEPLTVLPVRRRGSFLIGLCAWLWRVAIGSFLCMYYVSSVCVVGWTYRWMQALVLKGWWKRSKYRDEISFADYCAALGTDAPTPRPRWFWQERIRARMNRPGPDGAEPSGVRVIGRALLVPWHSLWRNFWLGCQGLFCAFLILGPALLFMQFSWEFGWVNSFTKGYEQAVIGPLAGVIGAFILFVTAMLYVPMAQVHQAATGRAAAFFEFRFIWRLVQTRLTAYVALAAVIAFFSLVIELFRVGLAFVGNQDWFATLSDKEAFEYLQRYSLGVCFVLFPLLLIARKLAAAVYSAAVLKALRTGTVAANELDARLLHWIKRLELDVTPTVEEPGLGRAVRISGRWLYRRLLFVLLIGFWAACIAKTYVGEFLNYEAAADGYVGIGFLNHEFILFPAFDHIPHHLMQAANAPP